MIYLIKYQASHNVIVMPGKEGFPNFVELGMSERRGDWVLETLKRTPGAPRKWTVARRWYIYWSLRTFANAETGADISALRMMKTWNDLEEPLMTGWVEGAAGEHPGLTFKDVGIDWHMDVLDDSWTEPSCKYSSKVGILPRLADLNCWKGIDFISCKGAKIGTCGKTAARMCLVHIMKHTSVSPMGPPNSTCMYLQVSFGATATSWAFMVMSINKERPAIAGQLNVNKRQHEQTNKQITCPFPLLPPSLPSTSEKIRCVLEMSSEWEGVRDVTSLISRYQQLEIN